MLRSTTQPLSTTSLETETSTSMQTSSVSYSVRQYTLMWHIKTTPRSRKN